MGKVLIVDDEAEIGSLLCALLQTEGHGAEYVSCVDEGLARLLEDDFGLVLCDLRMPESDGFDFVKLLRGSGNGIPVVLFSGFWTAADRRTASDLGIEVLLTKPIARAELARIVEDVLSGLDLSFKKHQS